jgi:hypothetical protein
MAKSQIRVVHVWQVLETPVCQRAGPRENDFASSITVGDSRDHRPDLKHLRFGLTVTAAGVPVWGRVPMGTAVMARSPASPSASCASICPIWARRCWWLTASASLARP